MSSVELYRSGEHCRIYRISGESSINRFIATTPETRRIANDPFVLGIDYTNQLETACARVLQTLGPDTDLHLRERETAVLNILRGGLNFGLRQAVHRAFGWNLHSSAFISAQRARRSDKPEEWYISENHYQKVYLGKQVSVVFGDVVATGTSLEFALNRLMEIIQEFGGAATSVVFFTIGGERSEEILLEIDKRCRSLWPNFFGSTIIYFEGRFAVADQTSSLSIKLTGTDLIRTQSILAPEFFESQLEDPAYPLERCTIYDAGSRAFYVPEYLEDVVDYWQQTLELSKSGLRYEDLLRERLPELQTKSFDNVNLQELCKKQIEKAHALLGE